MKYVYLVFYTDIVNMIDEIEIFDSVFENELINIEKAIQKARGD